MKIRPEFLIPIKSYADNTPEATPDILDCSLGENPYGFSSNVAAAIRNFPVEKLGHYPHSRAAHKAIIRHWAGVAALKEENIMLTDGSIGALYLINSLFAAPGAEVVGFAPTFTDMVVNAGMQNMTYRAVPMRADEGFKASVDDLLPNITGKTALVYLDNPNNPTGQTLSLPEIERVLSCAAEVDACVLADEAYADFIPRNESAVAFFGKYPNLILARTFSKGFGLAGLRAGCIIAPENIITYIGKISNPYMMNELTRVAVAEALADGDHPLSHIKDFSAVKKKLASCTGHALRLLKTDDRVPICTLQHSDASVDLQRLLYEAGVLTVSGVEFDGLGSNAVRLRVPKPDEAEKLYAAVKAVDIN